MIEMACYAYVAIAAIVALSFIIGEWSLVRKEGMIPDLILIAAGVGGLWPAWCALSVYVWVARWGIKD